MDCLIENIASLIMTIFPNITGKARNALGGGVGLWFNDFGGPFWHNPGEIDVRTPEIPTTGGTVKRMEDSYLRFDAQKANYLYKTTGTNQPKSTRLLMICRT